MNGFMRRSGGIDGAGSSDTIMEHIRKIRAKFSAHTLYNYIDTVWGCGISGMAKKGRA